MRRLGMTEQENIDHIGTCMLNCIHMNKPLPDRFLDAAEHFVKMAGFSSWCKNVVIKAIDERRCENALKRKDTER